MIEYDTNLYRKLYAQMTPVDFEICCVEAIKAYAQKENVTDFTVLHNQKLKTVDGTYQIDILCQFTMIGMSFKVLVECKRYKHTVERKVVAEMDAKLRSLGAQKGLIIATSGFQSGAVHYAEEHNIAPAQIVDAQIQYIRNSVSRQPREVLRFELEMRQQLPKYTVLLWDCKHDYPWERIYLTTQMVCEACEKAKTYVLGQSNNSQQG